MFYVPDSFIEKLISEDLPYMDLTVDALGIEDVPGLVECFPKQDCVLAGVEMAAALFEKVGARTELLLPSGSYATAKQLCLRAQGSAGAIHAVYKAAQNVMEYSSAIATRTAAMLERAVKVNPNIHICVTRKHFPGGKLLSLKAALAGGASPHRLGLSDSVLVFDQHRCFVDDFLQVLPRMKDRLPEKLIAVEADTPEEGLSFVRAGADIVQCERFAAAQLALFVKDARALNGRVKVTIAGGVNADNAAEFAAAGVDAIVTSWPYFGKPQDIKMKISRV
jgi:molybdenum transport protein